MGGDSSVEYLQAQLALRDARIIQLEAENDALSRRLHHQYLAPREPAVASFFWRRYVAGGSRLWRVLFVAASGGARAWRLVVRVGRRRA